MRLSRVRTLARAAVAVGLFTGFLILGGCTKATGVVTGKVTFKDKAVSGGTIGFIDPTGRTMGTPLNLDGSYSITLPTGEYTVTVETATLKPRDNSMGPAKMMPKGMQGKMGPGAGAGAGVGVGTGGGGGGVPKNTGPPKDAELPEGHSSSNPADAQRAKTAKYHVEIPESYGDKTKSSLKYTVVAGDQTKDFELK